MTVNAETAKSGPYTGNGSTTVHAYAFKVLDQDHITVTQTVIATGVETTLSISTHYSVSGVGTDGGGNITMVTAAPSTDTVTITRAVPQTQTTDLVNRGVVQPSVIETMGDRGVQMVQDFNESMSRALKLPVSTGAGISPELPAPVGDAFFKWNSAGTALESTTTSVGQTLGGDGTVSLPYYSFTADPNSGMYRIGADNVGFAMGGSKVVDIVAAGLNVTGTTTSSGVLSVDDATDTSSGTTGSIHTDGGVGIAKKLHVIGTTTHGGDVVSDTDSTDNLGTTGVRWKELFVDDITMGGDQTIGGNLTVSGNLTINGTTVTNDATNVTVKDFLIELNSGASTNANDMGIIMERGSTGDNAIIMWDESGDYFQVGTTTATGGSSGNLTVADGQLHAEGLVLSGTSSNLGTVTTLDLDGGTVDGAVIGGASAAAGTFTDLASTGDTTIGNATGDALTINPSAWTLANAVTITGTWTDLGTVTTADINGGTIDGAVIGGASAAAVTGTTVTGVSLVASQDLALATGATVTGIDDGVISTGSATLLATQGAIDTAINSSSKAAGISMTWETTTTDTDQGVGKVWANHGTLSSATVLYFDDVERNSVSINALIDSLDDATASTSATIYIQEAGSATAGVLFKVSGAVTSASTYSKVAVTHVATFGTLSDGDVVGVTFAFSGDDGTGDLLAANNLSDVASASSAASNIGVGTEDSPTFTKISVTGDTSAGDAAAIGYTAAEGLILTGQGSTSDLTVKNDADAVVFTVPTGTDDILFPDDAKAMWGTGSDSEIYHNGSNMYVKNDTGNTLLYSDTFQFFSHTGSETFAQLNHNSAVTLWYDNVKKFETSSTGVSLPDACSIDLSTPLLTGTDHTYTGLTAQMLAGGAISAFDLVCVHTTTSEVVEADASAYATARVIGIAPAAISDTATGTILLQGFIRDDSWNWTSGSTLYLSETAGAMTHTAPSTDGAFVLVVGVALSPDVVYINPSMDVIEHA